MACKNTPPMALAVKNATSAFSKFEEAIRKAFKEDEMDRSKIYYILNDKKEVVSVTADQWAQMFEVAENRKIAKNSFEKHDAEVSTVFLGMDHAYSGPPLIFESMVFGGKHDGYMRRYSTYTEAVEGHKAICRAFINETWEDLQ